MNDLFSVVAIICMLICQISASYTIRTMRQLEQDYGSRHRTRVDSLLDWHASGWEGSLK